MATFTPQPLFPALNRLPRGVDPIALALEGPRCPRQDDLGNWDHCKKHQRDAVGKASEFHVRGRVVSIDDVHRYLKRKGMSIEGAIALRAATPPDVRCCTPEAVPSSPANPEIFDAHRRILVSIRSYILGSVESNVWILDNDGEVHISAKSAHVIETCVGSFFTAFDLLQQKSFQKAGQFLIKGSAVIRDVLLEENPRLLVRLVDVVVRLRRSGWIDCSDIILNQFSEMAAIVLTEMHPLRRIFNCLISVHSELAEDILASAWQSFLDLFEQVMGASRITSIRNRTEYIKQIVRVRDPDVAEGQLRSMVEKCNEVLRSRDPRYLRSLLTLADFLRVQWRYGDAAAAAELLIRCAVEPKSEYSAQVWCHGMEVLAACQYGNSDHGLGLFCVF